MEIFTKILDLVFKKEPTEAQIDTCFILARQVFIKLHGHTPRQAAELAYIQVNNWIEEDKIDIALQKLWKSKIA